MRDFCLNLLTFMRDFSVLSYIFMRDSHSSASLRESPKYLNGSDK